MEQYDLWKLDKKLQKEVDEDRYHHTLGVMFTAASMAMVWGEDLEKARVAGLLHDCAKCIPNKKKITMCEKNKIEITEFERNNPFLIHAKLGAFLAKDKYKVEDPEILSAIIWHTTGKEDMTLLEKIIYIADYIEPARNKALPAGRCYTQGPKGSRKPAEATPPGNRRAPGPGGRSYHSLWASWVVSPPAAFRKCGKPARLSVLDAV